MKEFQKYKNILYIAAFINFAYCKTVKINMLKPILSVFRKWKRTLKFLLKHIFFTIVTKG